jgi:hypothetical protein
MTARSFPKHLSGIYSLENPLSPMHARILIPILFLIPMYSKAQLPMQDQVLMEDGRKLDGLIIEQKPGNYIRLWRLTEGDTITLEMDAIDRILRVPSSSTTAFPDSSDRTGKPKKSFGTNRQYGLLRFGAGAGEYGFLGGGIGAGMRVNQDLEIGIGAQYFGQNGGNSFPSRKILPLTMDLRYRLSHSRSGRFSSVLSLETGLAFSMNKDYYDEGRGRQVSIKNGLYVHPAIAFRTYFTPNFGLILDLGFQYNEGRLVANDSGEFLVIKRFSNIIVRGSLFF